MESAKLYTSRYNNFTSLAHMWKSYGKIKAPFLYVKSVSRISEEETATT